MIEHRLSSPSYWATHFGLALNPLFEDDEVKFAGDHCVLLDGGSGNFALSVCNERIWKDRTAADWCWSSNLPHHVTVTDRQVAVVRWDKLQPELLTRSSVESYFDQFYRYLAADRVRSNQRVAGHMMTIFRRIRSLVAAAQIDDDQSIDVFLEFLSHAIRQSGKTNHMSQSGALGDSSGESLLQSISASGVDNLLEYVTSRFSSELQLALVPNLAVRHAASEIFQEAHFELLRASAPDLFGYSVPAESKPVTRGGTHFTPPALARSIVEQAIAQVPDLSERNHLTILDPACGSGSFLHEALRTLRRKGFRGRLIIAGRDTSRPAISMAKFVLNNSTADWSPAGGCEIDIQQGDSLSVTLPVADVVLMNPPFVAWSALTSEQRQQMRYIIGPRLRGRGDLSMAFVSRAVESLAPGGVLGTLLPRSLLTLRAAEKWRKHLIEQTDMRFIASLGDYGLFTYAQVQVAAAVLIKLQSECDRRESVTALVATNDPEATGDALRALRATNDSLTDLPSSDERWRLFRTSTQSLRRRPTWRLTSPRTEYALRHLLDLGKAVPIGDLFHVRQGVRTGANPVFLLTTSQVDKLPKIEREWFLPAIMNRSIKNGLLEATHRVFYPYNRKGLVITSETDLVRLLPTYFEYYLQPERSRLEQRASVVRAGRLDWWGLSRRRAWALDRQPRLISKYFGGSGGFATDLEAYYIVVQGFAWFPKWTSSVSEFPVEDFLAAYMAVMNSTPFSRLLEIFSPQVAGGQFDLSTRYVKPIPVPNLPALSTDDKTGQVVADLANLGNNPRLSDSDWCIEVDHLTTTLLGHDFFNQV